MFAPVARCYTSARGRAVEGSIDYAPSLFALSELVAIQGAFVALVLSTRMRAAAGLRRPLLPDAARSLRRTRDGAERLTLFVRDERRSCRRAA